jgi:glycosyltransferase involved in cell wall biosynthesis
MAVYNGERFLGEAVASILAQTLRDFEFLIINDGSTDRTREVVLSSGDSRVRLVENDRNLGLARSLNIGLQLAQGEFVARQDADDISEPQRLAKQVDFLDAHPDVMLLGSGYKEIDASGDLIDHVLLPCDYTDIRWSLLFFCPFVHSAVMLRKSPVLRNVGFYSEELSYSMDYEFWLRIARSMRVANLGEHLVRLRTHPWSMTSTRGDSTKEGLQIRIANLAALLGWDETRDEKNAERFSRMSTMVFGSHKLKPENARELMRLHEAFCRHFDLDQEDCRTHREKLGSQFKYRFANNVLYA